VSCVLAVVLPAGLLLGACAGESSTSCRQPIREELDPGSLVHVIDAASAHIRTDPPTSGPHETGATPSGVVDEPMLGAVQVAILERGDVLIQHRDGLAAADVTTLNGLAGDHTVVAPNPALPAPVVASAWTYKLSCDAVDTAALERFVRDHAGKPINH
jgi:hypothetical protein